MDGSGRINSSETENKLNSVSSRPLFETTYAQAFCRKIEALLKYTNFIEIPERPDVTLPKKKSLMDYKISQLDSQSRPYELQSVATIKHTDAVNGQQVIKNDENKVLRYMSKGNAIDLNCRVVRKDNGEQIECRHLAQAYVQGTIGAKGNKFSKVNTPSKLSANLNLPTDSDLEVQKINQIHRESYYCNQGELGAALLDLIKKQKKTGCEVNSYLLNSLNHVMGLKIKVLPDREEVIIDYYDPNITNKVEHMIFSSSNAVASLSIKDFINSHHVTKYFPEKETPCCITSVDTMEDLKDCDVKIVGEVTYPMMYDLLTRGHFAHDAIRPKIHKFIQDNSQDKQTLEKLLAAKFFQEYPSALRALLVYGYTDSLKCYMEELLNSPLDDATKERILTAEHGGETGLTVVLQQEYKNAVRMYIDEVFKSNLSDDAKERLIDARDCLGRSAFYVSMQEGIDSKNIKLFMEQVLNSNLSLDAKKRLLSAKTSDDVSGLMIAIEATGNTKNIKVFVEVILNSTLCDDDKQELLDVVWNGYSILDLGKNNGFVDSVGVFEKAIQKSSLQPKRKASLLNRDL